MSELTELLTRRLTPSAEEDEPQQVYRVTVRMDYDTHQKLVRLASAFGASKTATCEDITVAAVKDAWEHYVCTLDEAHAGELYYEMEQERLEDMHIAEKPLGSGGIRK